MIEWENRIVIVNFRYETATTQPRTKTNLMLGCEIIDKYIPWNNPKFGRSTWTKKM